jgi:hypothetical protein
MSSPRRDAVVISARQLRGEKEGALMRTRIKSYLSSYALPVLHWAINLGAPLTTSLCNYAAGTDDLPLLRRLRALGCPWDEQTGARALSALATEGFFHPERPLELLQWARANGCPWDGRTCNAALSVGSKVGTRERLPSR